jgi:hypothetical protein
LFIPGNPGLVDFYIPFLAALQKKCYESNGDGASLDLSIIVKAHLGHSPALVANGTASPGRIRTELLSQVESAIELYDAIYANEYPEPTSDSTARPATKIVVAGHSVGAWIALQVGYSERNSLNHPFIHLPSI